MAKVVIDRFEEPAGNPPPAKIRHDTNIGQIGKAVRGRRFGDVGRLLDPAATKPRKVPSISVTNRVLLL
jgi:hypothetical protein